jgi:hypothetical protein
VIIAAKNLLPYLSSLAYPVAVLQTTGDVPQFHVDRPTLELLIREKKVIGVGSWNRIKHIRLNEVIELSPKPVPGRTYSSTSYLDLIPSGAISHKRQGKGSKMWIQRVDMAHVGTVGATRRMRLGPTFA